MVSIGGRAGGGRCAPLSTFGLGVVFWDGASLVLNDTIVSARG